MADYYSIMARPEGFEPPTTWFEARYSIQLSYGRAVSPRENRHYTVFLFSTSSRKALLRVKRL